MSNVSAKVLAQKADAYYAKREERLALDRQSDILKKEETALQLFLIDNLSKDDTTGVAGKVCQVTAYMASGFGPEDWAEIEEWARKKPDRMAIFKRGLNETFVKEWLSNPKNKNLLPPGVGRKTYAKLSIHKLK